MVKVAGNKSARRVAFPIHRVRDFPNGRAFGPSNHFQDGVPGFGQHAFNRDLVVNESAHYTDMSAPIYGRVKWYFRANLVALLRARTAPWPTSSSYRIQNTDPP